MQLQHKLLRTAINEVQSNLPFLAHLQHIYSAEESNHQQHWQGKHTMQITTLAAPSMDIAMAFAGTTRCAMPPAGCACKLESSSGCSNLYSHSSLVSICRVSSSMAQSGESLCS